MALPSYVLNTYKIGSGSDNIALALGAGGSWDDAKILHPCTVEVGGTVYLFYTGYDGAEYQIGVASEASAGFTGVGFAKDVGNPILSKGGGGSWDETGVHSPFVIYDGGTWKMWYAGWNGASVFKIGYATAANPAGPWTKHGSNPVVSNDLSWEGNIVMLPGVYKGSTSEAFDTTNLIAWWSMDETSSTRYDSHGIQNLTDYNTCLYAAGVVSNAAVLERATSEFLGRNDEAAIQTGDIDYTFAGWVNIDTLPTAGNFSFIISKEAAAATREYRLHTDDSGNLTWLVFGAGGAAIGQVDASTHGALSTDTWYFVEVWHDVDDNQVGIKINGGTADTAATSGAAGTAAANLGFGVYPAAYGGIQYFDGMLDEWLFLKRRLTNAEHTWLYNGGSGRAYSEIGHRPYLMLYTGNEPASVNGRIGFASSNDGVTWMKSSYYNNKVGLGAGGAWDDNSCFSSRTLVLTGSTYEAYYAGKPAAAGLSKIGYLSTADFVTWTRGANNPIVEADRAWEDSGALPPGETENLNYIQVGASQYVFYDAWFGNPSTIGAIRIGGRAPRNGVALIGNPAVV